MSGLAAQDAAEVALVTEAEVGDTIHKLPSGTTTGVLDVTGKSTGGEFQGTWQLGGSLCPKTSYRTKAGAGGSGD